MKLQSYLLLLLFLTGSGLPSRAEEGEIDRSVTLTDQNGVHPFEITRLFPDRVEVQQGQFKFYFNRSDVRKAENAGATRLLAETESVLNRIGADSRVGDFPQRKRELAPLATRLEQSIEVFGWLIPELSATFDRVNEAQVGMETALRIFQRAEELIESIRSTIRSGDPLEATWELAFEKARAEIEAIPFQGVRAALETAIEESRLEMTTEVTRNTRHHAQRTEDLLAEMRRALEAGEMTPQKLRSLATQVENSIQRIPLGNVRAGFQVALSELLSEAGSRVGAEGESLPIFPEEGEPGPSDGEPEEAAAGRPQSASSGMESATPAEIDRVGELAPPGPVSESDDSSPSRLEGLVGLVFLVALALGGAAFVLIRAGSRHPTDGHATGSKQPQPPPGGSDSTLSQAGATGRKGGAANRGGSTSGVSGPGRGKVGSFGRPSAVAKKYGGGDGKAPETRRVTPTIEPAPAYTQAETPPLVPLGSPRVGFEIAPPESAAEACAARHVDFASWDLDEPIRIGDREFLLNEGATFPGESPLAPFPLKDRVALAAEGRDGLRLTLLSGATTGTGRVASLSLLHERVNDCRIHGNEGAIWTIGPEGLTVCGLSGGILKPLGGFGFRESLAPVESPPPFDPRQQPIWCGEEFLILRSPNGVLHGVSVSLESGEYRFQEFWSHPSSTLSHRVDSNIAPVGGKILGLDETGALFRLDPRSGEVERIALPGTPFGSLGTDGKTVLLILAHEGGPPRLVRFDLESKFVLSSAPLPPGDDFEIHAIEDSLLIETPERLSLHENDNLSVRWDFPLEGKRLTHLHFDSTQLAVTLGGERVTILGRNSGVAFWEIQGSEQGFSRIAGALVDAGRVGVYGEGLAGGAFFRMVE